MFIKVVLLYKGERIKNVLSKVIPVEYKMYPDMGHFGKISYIIKKKY